MNRRDVEQVRVFRDYLEEPPRESGIRPIQSFVEQVQRWLELAETSLKKNGDGKEQKPGAA